METKIYYEAWCIDVSTKKEYPLPDRFEKPKKFMCPEDALSCIQSHKIDWSRTGYPKLAYQIVTISKNIFMEIAPGEWVTNKDLPERSQE